MAVNKQSGTTAISDHKDPTLTQGSHVTRQCVSIWAVVVVYKVALKCPNPLSPFSWLLISKLSSFQDTCKASPCFHGLEHDGFPYHSSLSSLLGTDTGTEVKKGMTLPAVSHFSPFLFLIHQISRKFRQRAVVCCSLKRIKEI